MVEGNTSEFRGERVRPGLPERRHFRRRRRPAAKPGNLLLLQRRIR
jgi:hypothetical protein